MSIITTRGSIAQFGQSGGLLIRRSGVQIPLGPPSYPTYPKTSLVGRGICGLKTKPRYPSIHQVVEMGKKKRFMIRSRDSCRLYFRNPRNKDMQALVDSIMEIEPVKELMLESNEDGYAARIGFAPGAKPDEPHRYISARISKSFGAVVKA